MDCYLEVFLIYFGAIGSAYSSLLAPYTNLRRVQNNKPHFVFNSMYSQIPLNHSIDFIVFIFDILHIYYDFLHIFLIRCVFGLLSCHYSTVDYFGLTIQHNLKWDKQADKFLKRLRAPCATIFSVRNVIEKDLLKSMYFSLFESHIRYGLLYMEAPPSIL